MNEAHVRSSVAVLVLALAGGLPGLAGALATRGSLPGMGVRAIAASPAALAILGESELRTLRPLDSGILRLEMRQIPAVAGGELVHAGRSVAQRDPQGRTVLYNLPDDEPRFLEARASALCAHEDAILAASADGLWLGSSQDGPHWGRLGDPFRTAPTALCMTPYYLWAQEEDSLRAFRLRPRLEHAGCVPLAGTRRLSSVEGRMLALLEGDSLALMDADSASGIPLARWSCGSPCRDAFLVEDELAVALDGDSLLALWDLADPRAPRRAGQWRAGAAIRHISASEGTVWVVDQETRIRRLAATRDAGRWRLEQQACGDTRPALSGGWFANRDEIWLLDRKSGFHQLFDPGNPAWPMTVDGIGLPTPVDGGDIAINDSRGDILLAGCTYGAGLRFYAAGDDGIALRGIHPTDPVKLLAWGPEDLIAYVTPEAFVAVKQARRDPWYLLHHGTVDLRGEPLCVRWVDRQLWVGCTDGRLVQVDATDPLHPVVRATEELGAPVTSLACMPETGQLHAAAGRLFTFQLDSDGSVAARDSLELQGEVRQLAGRARTLLAGTASPDLLVQLDCEPLLAPEPVDELPLDAPPSLVALANRAYEAAPALAGLENGDLLQFAVSGWPDPPGPGDSLPPELAVFPNPAPGWVRLDIRMWNIAPVELGVHNLAGQRILRRDLGLLPKGENLIPLETGAWASGVYIVTLSSQGSRVSAKLLLVR